MFSGRADTKIVVVVAFAAAPAAHRTVLHAVFRRTGEANAERVFHVDYYDLHWLPASTNWGDWRVWRSGLLGGRRVWRFLSRLSKYRTLGSYAAARGWEAGQGFIRGNRPHSRSSEHIVGRPLLPPYALKNGYIEEAQLETTGDAPVSDVKSARSFTPPLFLVRKHRALEHAVWTESYLTYADEIVGFAAKAGEDSIVAELAAWFGSNLQVLQAFAAVASIRLYHKKATSLGTGDVLNLPYPENGDLDLSRNEMVIASDIVNHFHDFVRLGDGAPVYRRCDDEDLAAFEGTFVRQIGAVYSTTLTLQRTQRWPGVLCQIYTFGEAKFDWSHDQDLRYSVNALLTAGEGLGLSVTRIARLYDHNTVILLKPDRLRFWLESVALRDADDVLADLRAQGF
jgi:hypothetical protein